MPNKDIVPALFEGHRIRRASDEGTIYYSAVDIIAAITNTLNPNDLWYQTKKNLSKDEIQLSNIIRRFKLQSANRKPQSCSLMAYPFLRTLLISPTALIRQSMGIKLKLKSR